MEQPDLPEDSQAGPFAPIGWRSYASAPSHHPRFRLHRLPPRFVDSEIERRFIEAYRRSTISFRRLALAIGILAFAGFAPVDRLTNPQIWPQLWWIRFGVAVPILAATIGLGYWRRVQDYYGYLITLALIASSLCLIVMMHVSAASAVAQYYSALVLLLPVSFGFLRLRFAASLATGIFVSAAYGVEVFWLRPLAIGELAYSLGYLVAACLVGVALVYLMELQARQAFVLAGILDEASIQDPLTGVHNRRGLELSIQQLAHTYRRYGPPFSLVLLDLDGFKSVNDELGYKAGDDVLCRFARTVAAQIRAADSIYRYGGDEFVILCPATDGSAAKILADRLMRVVGKLDLEDLGHGQGLSFSVGIAEIGDPGESVDDLFARANAALREAKRAGKGRAMLADADPAAVDPDPD